MTGPEHYKMSEDILADVQSRDPDDFQKTDHYFQWRISKVGEAQAHAMLALAAAFALPPAMNYDDADRIKLNDAWCEALKEK